jgi:hypothetical protein
MPLRTAMPVAKRVVSRATRAQSQTMHTSAVKDLVRAPGRRARGHAAGLHTEHPSQGLVPIPGSGADPHAHMVMPQVPVWRALKRRV